MNLNNKARLHSEITALIAFLSKCINTVICHDKMLLPWHEWKSLIRPNSCQIVPTFCTEYDIIIVVLCENLQNDLTTEQ